MANNCRSDFLWRLPILLLFVTAMVEEAACDSATSFTLDSIRDSLVRQEDTIIFSLIERAKFPLNSAAYTESFLKVSKFSGSIVQYIIQGSEALQAKVGRYENPEEVAFFPANLPPSAVHHNFTKILYPAAAGVSINKNISDIYFNQLLPLFVAEGDDGNYGQTTAADLACLQALSRRIHDGRIVAELKYTGSPQDYETAIRNKDINALMKLLTVASLEEIVKKRVEKKAMVFAQEVTLDDNKNNTTNKYKVDPSIVRDLYEKWVIPLTKDVEIEYLLHRLD
ncbi:chorismate mutase 2-like [Malania oleifera]|uniref:chorismate mutase 2-like n=1 Tax=Malania oleifera TaxID=397392 RepID=UPI0025ADF288|nr:chorismate mutase 2-like [Malania oleifera]